MDLNYLYQRHQISLVMAERADSALARRIHREFADRYGDRIAEARLARIPLGAA